MYDLQSLLPDLVQRPGGFARTDFVTAAEPGSLCFAATDSYLARANANPNVSCLITAPELAGRADARLGLAVSEAPLETFYRLHNHIALAGGWRPPTPGGVSLDARIHPTAVVEAGACIEAGVEVAALAWIGATSWLQAGSLVDVGARIGVEGHFFKRFGGRLQRIRHVGGVRIGPRSHVLANAIVQRALYADFTEVGADTVLGPGVHLGHGVKVGARCTIAGSVQVAGYTSIGDDVWVGPGAVIGNLLRIGDRAKVEIGSVVAQSVGEGERVSGAFAQPHMENLRAAARARLGR